MHMLWCNLYCARRSATLVDGGANCQAKNQEMKLSTIARNFDGFNQLEAIINWRSTGLSRCDFFRWPRSASRVKIFGALSWKIWFSQSKASFPNKGRDLTLQDLSYSRSYSSSREMDDPFGRREDIEVRTMKYLFVSIRLFSVRSRSHNVSYGPDRNGYWHHVVRYV